MNEITVQAGRASAADPVEGDVSIGRMAARFFGVVARPATWANLLYLWMAFPLGLAYFVLLSVGWSLGLGLLIVWVGFLVVAALLALSWGVILFERLQMEVLLRHPLGPARRVAPSQGWAGRPSGFREWARSVLGSPALWKGLVFMVVKFPLGLIGWIGSLVGLSVSLGLLVAVPLALFADLGVSIDDWRITGDYAIVDVNGWSAFAVWLAGLFGLLFTLHVQNALVGGWKILASWLLEVRGDGNMADPPPALDVVDASNSNAIASVQTSSAQAPA